MRKFKPLDLSFMAAANSPERESIRNVAAMINANGGWSQSSQVSLNEYNEMIKTQKAEAAKNKPTFLSGLFDTLSIPLYAVANALDESIAGHQSDNNDSVLQDTMKSIGGVFTGGVKGIGAGFRGGTSMIDVLPGIDISDKWQQDGTDKSRFGDVNVRLTSKMSTADAMKPENWSKAKANIQKEKNEVPGWLQDIFYTDLDSPDAQKDYLRKMKMIGIGQDIAADPLNFASFGGKAAISAPGAILEGVDAARNVRNVDEIMAGLTLSNKKAPTGDKFTPPPIEAGAKTLKEIAPSNGIDIKFPGQFDVAPPKGNPKEISSIQKKLPDKAGLEISKRDQSKLVKDISRLAEEGRPDWIYKAADLMRPYKKINFENTERFLDLIYKVGRAKGLRHNAANVASSLSTRLSEDVLNSRQILPSENILNTAPAEAIILGPTKKKLNSQQAAIANNVVAQFSKQVLGKEKAPGTGPGLANAISIGANARWSGPQQARMWNQITSSLNFTGPKKYEIAARILQQVEDYFLTKGAIPHSGTKLDNSIEGLRLSRLAMAIGPKSIAENPNLITSILRGDERALESLSSSQIQAIENLKASEAMASAPATAKGIQTGKNFASEVLAKTQSLAKTKNELKNAGAVAEKSTVNLGGGPVAAKVAKEYVTKLTIDSFGIESMSKVAKLKTETWLAKSVDGIPKNDPKFSKAVVNSIYKAAELPSPAQLGKIAGAGARVRDGFGALFNAAYGVKDMRHIFLRNQASALSTAARRAQYINKIAREYPPKDVDLWHEAFRAAQIDDIMEGNVAGLQAEISKTMGNLFGETGLKAGIIADSTVAGRSRLAMTELNSQMKRFGLSEYQFTNGKKVKDNLGNTRDFSQGPNWLNSWETWNVKNPYEFLHKIQQVVEHSVREKIMFDEIAGRFGSTRKSGGVKYAVSHPRLGGIYFTQEGARQGEQFVKILKEINTPNAKALQHIDHVISKIKAALTIYIPSHHWTNVIGDVMFNWYAGVNKPHRYTQAIKILQSQKGRYGDIASFQKGIAGPDAFKQAMARGVLAGNEGSTGLKIHPLGNSVILTMRNGQKVTADMLYVAAMREGILPSARVLEEVTTDVSSILDKFRPLGGRGQRLVHQVSEVRDHIPRMAQFVDGIAKSRGNFESSIETVAANVRKWHPDGIDLTKFERGVMKRIFPFYSWTRKAIPLAIESAIIAGNKVMAYPRLMEELAAISGIDSENNSSSGSFPTDQLIPDWIRDRGISPVAGGPGSYLFVNPSTPALDIFTMMGHPGQASLDMLNPAIKIPTELAQGSTLGKQVPIENEADYLARQIPGVSHAGRISGYYGTSDSVANSQEQKILNLINFLTGAKATQSGIYQKSAQFDLRDYLKKKAKGDQ